MENAKGILLFSLHATDLEWPGLATHHERQSSERKRVIERASQEGL